MRHCRQKKSRERQTHGGDKLTARKLSVIVMNHCKVLMRLCLPVDKMLNYLCNPFMPSVAILAGTCHHFKVAAWRQHHYMTPVF